ncbi:MAG: diguanylate cyclase [Candidatus Aminicenantes bacterium]|nr:diguanylate cyclase [Candidatus Aminicenantes bacterium]
MEKTRILIVEDEGLVAQDIENMIRNVGYEICGVVTSGEEAVAVAAETDPDLILMDIILKGGMDGVEAAEKIRERFNIPVIYLTAHTDEITLERAKLTEPLGYSLKPVEQKELLTVIEMALYKHQMERRLREREGWLTTILQGIGEGVIATDRQGSVTFMNPVAERLTGWRQAESINKPLANILHLIDEESGKLQRISVPRLINENLRTPLNGNVLIVNYEEKIPVELTTTIIMDEKGNVNGLVLVLHDLTERKRYEAKLRYNAVHDHLTELPNRLLFFDRLNLALAQAQRDRHGIAVLMLDLDEFKKVNDTWGHSTGDKLLQGVAHRLSHMFRKGDTIARLGGDEFVLILPEMPSPEVARNIAERVVLSFQKPFELDGLKVSITASLGITVYPDDGEDTDALVRNADVAMYKAKIEGKNRYCAYSQELREYLRH